MQFDERKIASSTNNAGICGHPKAKQMNLNVGPTSYFKKKMSIWTMDFDVNVELQTFKEKKQKENRRKSLQI